MKTLHRIAAATAALCTFAASAHDLEPGGTIAVACGNGSVQMAAVVSAVENGHYWAPESARRRMLSLARHACSLGATVVTFLPPAGQRSCRTPPTWSTLCVDQAAAMHEVADSATPPALPERR